MNVVRYNIIIFLFLFFGLNQFVTANHVKFDSLNCKGYKYFISKGILFDSTSNLKLYNEVYDWLGVPYRYGGRSKSGADCSGFASQIYKHVYNISVGGSAADIYKRLMPIEKADLKEGDLVFFKIKYARISHVGVYLSNNKFIHATSFGKSVTVSDLNENYYKRYYYSAGRVKEEILNTETEIKQDSLTKPQR